VSGTRTFLLIACMAGAPFVAQAQAHSAANDSAYCAKLSDIYVRYIGHDNSNADNFLFRGTNDAQVATTQCQGNSGWAISILEQQLTANKFTLPARD